MRRPLSATPISPSNFLPPAGPAPAVGRCLDRACPGERYPVRSSPWSGGGRWRSRSAWASSSPGCGFLDGAEIHEAVCTLLSLDRRGAKLVAAAPDVPQLHVVDHVKGAPAEGERAACSPRPPASSAGRSATSRERLRERPRRARLPGRLRRGEEPLLFAVEGRAMRVLPEVERIVREMRGAGKPMGFICISPVIAARLLGAGRREGHHRKRRRTPPRRSSPGAQARRVPGGRDRGGPAAEDRVDARVHARAMDRAGRDRESRSSSRPCWRWREPLPGRPCPRSSRSE